MVYSTHGMVASSQPLATEAGIRILKEGGNAAVRFPIQDFPWMLEIGVSKS